MGRGIWPFSLFIFIANILTWGIPLVIVTYITKFYTEQVKDISAGPNVILGLFILTFSLFIVLGFMPFSVQHSGMFLAQMIILSIGFIFQFFILMYYFVDYGGFIDIIGLCWRYIDLIGLNFYFQQKYQCCGYRETWLCDPSYKPCYQYIHDEFKSLSKPLVFCTIGIICSFFAFRAVRGDRVEDGDEIDEDEVPPETSNDVEERTAQQSTRRRSSAYINSIDMIRRIENSKNSLRSESLVSKDKLEKTPPNVKNTQEPLEDKSTKRKSEEQSHSQNLGDDETDSDSVSDASDSEENSIPNSILTRSSQNAKSVKFSSSVNTEVTRSRRARKTRRSSAITKIDYPDKGMGKSSPKKRRRKTTGL